MKIHLTESLVSYKPVSSIWFDGNREIPWKRDYGRELCDFLRQVQPTTLLGNRIEAQPKDRNSEDLAPVEVSDSESISET